MANQEILTGADAFKLAQQKARFGRRDWIFWRDRDGVKAAKASAETIKAALLARGTRGDWTLISASTAHLYRMNWRLGIGLLANMKRGWA